MSVHVKMGRPKGSQNTTPVRLTEEALRWARIAAGYTGESVSAYVSRIVEERGREDAEKLHAELASRTDKPKPKR